MLTRLLTLIRQGGVYTTDELAARLGVSRTLIEAMLAHLVRSGYLESPAGGGFGCAACTARDGCKIASNHVREGRKPEYWQCCCK